MSETPPDWTRRTDGDRSSDVSVAGLLGITLPALISDEEANTNRTPSRCVGLGWDVSAEVCPTDTISIVRYVLSKQSLWDRDAAVVGCRLH